MLLLFLINSNFKKKIKKCIFNFYKFYKYFVILFNFHNILIKFQSYINKTLQNYFNVFVSVYMNDILIYSNILIKHKYHIY